jgi:hypothetical protein
VRERERGSRTLLAGGRAAKRVTQCVCINEGRHKIYGFNKYMKALSHKRAGRGVREETWECLTPLGREHVRFNICGYFYMLNEGMGEP